MNIGMPSLIELAGLDECCELAKKLKLDFVELNMNMPSFRAEALNA